MGSTKGFWWMSGMLITWPRFVWIQIPLARVGPHVRRSRGRGFEGERRAVRTPREAEAAW